MNSGNPGHQHHPPHPHHHHQEEVLSELNGAIILAIVLNLGYVLVEVGYGLWIHSLSLIMDAGHNLSDVAGLGLTLMAFRLARIKPTQKYTYGYRKTSILTALFNAMVLLIIIGATGYAAVRRLMFPQQVSGGTMALVAAAGILINGFSALLFIKNREKDLNLQGAYLHLAADALVAAGVVLTGLLIHFTHWYWLDPVTSFLIMIVIFVHTWKLLGESLRLSLDGVPSNIHFQEVEQAALKINGVLAIHHIHIWALSTSENALTAHIEVDANTSIQIAGKIRQELKEVMETLHIRHSTFEMEITGESCEEGNC
ncbi:MAG: cation diffusion facilitator family transporter [Chitinophagaceae bacterium]